MTENETIKNIITCATMEIEDLPMGMGKTFDVAIKALEEVQQYRAIGTPEECRAAMEKQTAKKIISFEYRNGAVNYGCPVCKRKLISKINGEWCAGTFNEHCDRCGQKLDWDRRANDGKTD